MNLTIIEIVFLYFTVANFFKYIFIFIIIKIFVLFDNKVHFICSGTSGARIANHFVCVVQGGRRHCWYVLEEKRKAKEEVHVKSIFNNRVGKYRESIDLYRRC